MGMLKSRRKLIIHYTFLLLFLHCCSSSDTLTQSESLARNNTLVSAGGKFELGFFTPPGGDKIYLGICYFNLSDKEKTYVWIANRDSPALSPSVSLNLRTSGQIFLSVLTGSGVVWSSNNTPNAVNPVLRLLDSGNLVVREVAGDSEDYLWQSFNHPTDTLLPGQKLGWDEYPGEKYLTSWKSSNDPSSGEYTYRINRAGDAEIFLLKDNTQKIFRSGPWVGQRLCGIPPMNDGPSSLNFTFEDNPGGVEVYYEVNVVDPTIMTRAVLTPDGVLRRFTWAADTNWSPYWYNPKDLCDFYNTCGAYGVCDASNQFECACPHGFEPRDLSAWGRRDWSGGCVRRTGLGCGSDGFRVLRDMKLPESGGATVFREMGLDECREMCRRDCNCTAFADWRVVNGVGTGCVIWTGILMDMRSFTDSGQNLYIRLAASELKVDKAKKLIIGVGVLVGVVLLLIAIASFRFAWKRKLSSASNSIDDLELPLYDFEAVMAATNNFSFQNKIGEGGFGPVYKGVLKEGQVVAIKRLSRESMQGAEEFKNEVKLIAKLQHRNLVRLLACCLEGREKILIYEYLPNRSLDTLLFAVERRPLLDWKRRFNIICGIARGLQYLHHDSRFRIIHRDFKASNILLDHDMNPKISDFGIARLIFGGDETGANNTRRVVGTYGYMAPEYAMDGIFSIKSDVFSFGVLVLEIVSGKKNTGSYNSDDDLNLLGYAWKRWKEGKGRELVDESIGDSYSEVEVERCIQIGLLCVQDRAEERPTMSSVVVALSSESAPLPYPKLPGFCFRRTHNAGVETDSSSSQQTYHKTFSVNEVTDTLIHGR